VSDVGEGIGGRSQDVEVVEMRVTTGSTFHHVAIRHIALWHLLAFRCVHTGRRETRMKSRRNKWTRLLSGSNRKKRSKEK
jgi:hypothetical protein